MARSVTGLFATWDQVASVDGALRDAGIASDKIIIVGPDGQMARIPSQARERPGVGAWLVQHLVRQGHPQVQAQIYHDTIVHEGRWLVSAVTQNDAEDADARNLMVTAGASEISSVADGTMVRIDRPGAVGTGSHPSTP